MGWPNTLVNPVFDPDELGHPQQYVSYIQRDDSTHEIFIYSIYFAGTYEIGITKYAADTTVSAQVTADPLGNSTFEGSGLNFGTWLGIARGGSKIFMMLRQTSGGSGSPTWTIFNRSDLSYSSHVTASGYSSLLYNPNQLAVAADESVAVSLSYNGGTGHYTLLSILNVGGAVSACTDIYSALSNQSAHDIFFDGSGFLWVACFNGKLAKFSISGTTPTLVNTFTPIADGVGITKLTYRPTSNELILWYADGRIALWDISLSALTGSIYTLSGGVPGGGSLSEFGSDRSVARDDAVFCTMYGSIVAPYFTTIDVTTGIEKTYFTSLWNGFDGTNGSRGTATYESTHSNFWLSRLGNFGFVIASAPSANAGYTRVWGNLLLP